MSGLRTALTFCGALLAAVVVTIVPALGTSMAFFPLDTRRIDPKMGQTLFERKCAACHAISPHAPAGYGPSLSDISQAAALRKPGLSAAEYLRESIVEPEKFRSPGSQGEMPRGLASHFTDAQLMSLIAYLQSQQGIVPYRELLRLPGPEPDDAAKSAQRLTLDSIEKGRQLYLGKLQCIVCHPLEGAPGPTLAAPSLGKVGYQTRDYLRESILHPSKQVANNYVQYSASEDGHVTQGRRLEQTDEVLRLLTIDKDGHRDVVELRISALEPLDEEHEDSLVVPSKVSSMPDYSQTIQPDELEALLDFLATMR